MENTLIEVIETSGLEKTEAKTILDSFTGFFDQAKEWEAKAKTLVVTDVSQVEEMKQAREARLALKDIRVNAENTRKERKERSLREGKAIDGIANVVKALIIPIEEYLEKQEKFAEHEEQKRKEKIYTDRVAALLAYVDDTTLYNLKEMSSEGFNSLLESTRTAHEARVAAEKKAAEERAEKEKAERAENERIRVENERLKAEAEEREKSIAAERAEAEQERKTIEAAAAAKLKVETEAREKIEKEAREKERKDAEKKAVEAETKRQAELAPDKDKLVALAAKISLTELPTVGSKEAQAVIAQAKEMLNKVAVYINQELKNL